MIAFMAFMRRLLPWLGVMAPILAALLAAQAIKTHHWHSAAVGFESQWKGEKIAHQQTIINYQRAAEKARQDDLKDIERVRAEQQAISNERVKSYEERLAAARAAYERLRQHFTGAPAHPSGSGTAPLPGVDPSAGGTDGSPGEDGFSLPDRLIATTQAIQLDELQKWVRATFKIDVNGSPTK